jgi:micrococcal nuclease
VASPGAVPPGRLARRDELAPWRVSVPALPVALSLPHRTVAAMGAFAVALLATSAARADPYKAVPDRGPAPATLGRGANFEGSVVYVGDADSLCVATGAAPTDWIEVRLADFYGPELHAPGGEAGKTALTRIVFGRHVSCRAAHQSYDRIVATCSRDGVSVGDLMRRAGIVEGGRGR